MSRSLISHIDSPDSIDLLDYTDIVTLRDHSPRCRAICAQWIASRDQGVEQVAEYCDAPPLRVLPIKALSPYLCEYAIPHLCALPHALALPWPLLAIYSDTNPRAAPCIDRIPCSPPRAYPVDTRLAIRCDCAIVRLCDSASTQDRTSAFAQKYGCARMRFRFCAFLRGCDSAFSQWRSPARMRSRTCAEGRRCASADLRSRRCAIVR